MEGMPPESPACPRVLVVDDEPSHRAVLSANLRREGYEPVQATNGAEAIDALAMNDIDVVVTDLKDLSFAQAVALIQELSIKTHTTRLDNFCGHGSGDAQHFCKPCIQPFALAGFRHRQELTLHARHLSRPLSGFAELQN